MALFPSKPAVQEIFTSRDPLVITSISFGGFGTSAGQKKKKKKETKTETKINKKLELLLMIAKRLR